MKLRSLIKSLILAGVIIVTPMYAGLVQAQAASANTGPNKVYIEQIGNTNKIIIDQIGGTNNVGGTAVDGLTVDTSGITTLTPTVPSSTNYATVNGSTNNITLKQQGDANSAQYNIKGGNNNYTSTVTGDSNQTKLTMGDTNTNTTYSNVTETITGNRNLLIQQLVGTQINSTTTIVGDDNQVTAELKTSKGTNIQTITGNSNVVNAQQIDVAGASGHYLKNVISGDYNSITTQQQGTNDSTIDIKTAGDHNTITVRSTNAATVLNPVTAIVR